MIVTYFWNVALCQSLYASLGAVDVAIRNGIHHALSVHFGHADWYDRTGLFQTREIRDIAIAKKSIVDAGKVVVPGRVIAAMHFGFWPSILSTAYGDRPTGPQLWTPTNGLLARAFPEATPLYQGSRRRAYNRIDSLRRLRNRVFHYEPIWNGVLLPARQRKRPPHVVSLADLQVQIINTIGWVSPPLQETTTYLDTFPDVLSNGYAEIELKIMTHLGMPASDA